ncbi:MAG TPA: DUF4190 domain-containing protein [Cellulomonas sp.]
MTAPGPFSYPDQPFYAPGWQPPRPRTEPLALVALVAGVLGTGPVAIVLGALGIRSARRHGRRGRGLALAGLVLGLVGTLGWAALGTVAVGTAVASRPLPADVTGPRTAHAVQLVTGSCLADLPSDPQVDEVQVVPCAQEHLAQVLTTYAFTDDEDWPGDRAATARVEAACTLTAAEQATGLRLVAWSPTEGSWADGDRTGLCLAVAEQPGTGSLLG